ncbi:GNAT family N-acetyltransferase [Vibrio parahaemolyticus]|uniref:GNAT family N-acetyltransferase n=1 Tax=Vibrio parahaemolyticus TaxID=670 RepID=UPI0004D9E77A|nr:GNAT family N-acetyltransferase [Vibrio parahaemolyticus]EHR7857861.1 GNAT family N-acetyltransferase [Vibrio parahaemolyticus]EHS2671028.1 GNAT family N-acetyltransferase [Vibrio parahaemolyticus]EHU6458578.1 GNAT family N-acetyltransferase [Vibrio parahaemolyticus]EHU6485047.1 GNAT family N-acetyltransferase [Vibrio parahaemolyticus]EHU9581062.1 GNAT family N-acetyltransferase [Vibrio parahaemolyticus]
MELILKISVVTNGEIEAYEASLNAHLNSVFGQDSTVHVNDEFVCAVLIEDDSQIVATGFAYSRLMSQGSINFKAGIVGGISVAPNKRGLGLAKVIVKKLDKYLVSFGVTHSFLFAYDPDVYRSSGYSELVCPIHYYDTQQKNWNEFVYRGGMVKTYNVGHALSNQVIEFDGCVY